MADEAIGAPKTRVDGRLKVTGQATYAAEHDVPGLVYGWLVTSTISLGRVTAIDTAAALAAPGVLRVLTDLSGAALAYTPDRVHFLGQPLAIVIGTTLEQTEHGASLVEITYEQQRPVTDMLDPGATIEVAVENPDYERGDPDAALAAGPFSYDHTYTVAREHHNPIELPSTIAWWDGDQLTMYDKTQWVQGTAGSVARALNVSQATVRVLSPFVGGAFGSQGMTWPHQPLTALAARQVGRPVKIVLTRRQMYGILGYRAQSVQRLRLSADATGVITGLVHEPHTETSRYEQYEDSIVDLVKMIYHSPNMRSRYRTHAIDTHTPTFMRGPGEGPAMFALESTMDQLANDLGIDPIELRKRNEPAVDPATGHPFTSRRLVDCYDEGARRFGWSARNPTPRSRREGNLLIGMGMATAGYFNNRRSASAHARINADGTALVYTATSDIGPGTYTSMTQVSADALGIRMDRVTFQLGDSAMPAAPMHSGSKTMGSVGSAVLTACLQLRDSVIRTAVVDPASPLYGAPPAGVSVVDGRLFVTAQPAKSETYQQVLARRRLDHVDTEQSWNPGDVDSHYTSYAYGAVFAEVSVDESLGLIRVRRIFAAYDVGRVVNPKLAHSQAIGGMVAGIGMSLLEQAVIDRRDGRTVNANLADYLVPVNADVPELDAVFLNSTDPFSDPLGVKGLGEVVIVGVPGAIANAVHNATGYRAAEFPITLDQLLPHL
ncbi:xanthine dehydrogenase family protein molybdopterin-binding subunit [Kutzneria sp. NPDC052558]|uniref:xanthine dehydrogenase family protein molybdopterin-binding subunit n=1 Tax=Kutzneria sp. NPDC052558 TaxID=3364121 RepID=UPI0037C99671